MMSSKTVLPVVRYRDPVAAGRWLCDAYGFEVHHTSKRDDGQIAYLVVKFGDHQVLVSSDNGDDLDDLMVQPAEIGDRSTQICYLTVDAVDDHCAHAQRIGARIEIAPEDGEAGRFYMSRDPEGHLWCFGKSPAGTLPVELNDTAPKVASIGGRQNAGGYRWMAAAAVVLAFGFGLASFYGDGSSRNAKASNTRSSITKLEAKLGTSRKQLEEANSQIDTLAGKLRLTEMASLEEIAKKHEVAKAATLRGEQASRELENEREKAAVLRRSHQKAVKELAGLRTKHDELTDETRRLRLQVAQLDDAKTEARQTAGRLVAVQIREAHLRQKLAMLRQSVTKSIQASRELQEERKRSALLQASRDEAVDELVALRAEYAELTGETQRLRVLVARLNEAQAESEQSASDLAAIRQSEANLRQKLSLLSDQAAQMIQLREEAERKHLVETASLKKQLVRKQEALDAVTLRGNRATRDLQQERKRLASLQTSYSEAMKELKKLRVEVSRLTVTKSQLAAIKKHSQKIRKSRSRSALRSERRRRQARSTKQRSRLRRFARKPIAGNRKPSVGNSGVSETVENNVNQIPRDKKRRHELLGALFDCASSHHCD